MTKEELKQLRLRLKLTQTQFSEKIGYSRQHIAAVEQGKRPIGIKLIKVIKNK